jgi:flagellar FliL protein
MKSDVLGALAKRFILGLVLLMTLPVFAAEHGGGAAAGPEPMAFVVNVGNSAEALRFLQIALVLEYASPEVAVRFTEIKPKLQHRIILMLSSEEIANLQTVKGKQDLQARIAKDLNTLVGETEETGIKEVLFTNFILQ